MYRGGDGQHIYTDRLSITAHIKTPFFKSPTCHAEDLPANSYTGVRNGSCQGKEGSQEQRPWKADEPWPGCTAQAGRKLWSTASRRPCRHIWSTDRGASPHRPGTSGHQSSRALRDNNKTSSHFLFQCPLIPFHHPQSKHRLYAAQNSKFCSVKAENRSNNFNSFQGF